MIRQRSKIPRTELNEESTDEQDSSEGSSHPPPSPESKWRYNLLKTGLIISFIYLAIPIWFYYSPWLRRQCVFLHNFHWPPFETSNLSQPAFFNVPCTRNFYLESEPGIRLGVWHIMPGSSKKCQDLKEAGQFDDQRPIVLYFHGNSMNRASLYRRELYRALTQSTIDAHVVAFDYRAYGDSTYGKPTVETLVRDADFVYKWLVTRVPRSRVVIWGHSLGSGVATQLAAKMTKIESPAGIVLEAPFTNIPDATSSFPLSFLHRQMPYFYQLLAEPSRHPETNFNTDEKIGQINAPLLILHAADDGMVGVHMGRKLAQIAKVSQSRDVRRAEYVELEASQGCGHLFISRSPQFVDIVNKFFVRILKKYM